jgi:hypothetical protein
MQMDTIIEGRQSLKKNQGFSETAAAGFSYDALRVYFRGPSFKPGGLSEKDMMASFRLNTCISPLFPYLNAVVRKGGTSPDAAIHQVPL